MSCVAIMLILATLTNFVSFSHNLHTDSTQKKLTLATNQN